MISVCIFAAFLAIMSVITFALYSSDKKKAKQGQRRIPEKTLLLFSFFGGAIGGFLAMQIKRHKTKAEHWYFTVVNLLGVAWQVAVLVVLLIFRPF